MFNIKAARPLRAAVVATLAASAIAVCASPSFARHHNNNPNNTATEVTTTVSPSGAVDTTVASASVPIDYRILADPDLNYFDIRRARAYGLTDYQIGQAAKLAHYAYVRLDRVLSQIEDGNTIADLAFQYGVPMDVVLHAGGWQDRVNNYMEAYRTTGYGALRNPPPAETVASYTSTTGTAGTTMTTPDGTTTMTPEGTATTVTPEGTTTTTTPEGTTTTTTPEGTSTTTTPGGATTTTPAPSTP